jgi:hypothetical protein
MTHPLTIGQVAEHTGVAAQTFWYYEGVGVPPAATAAGYRPRNSCLNTSLIEVRDRGHASQVTDFAASNGARDGVGPRSHWSGAPRTWPLRSLAAVLRRSEETQLSQRG